MKVLHVTPSFYPATVYGGPLETGWRLCVAEVAEGLELRVLTTDANGVHTIEGVSTSEEMRVPPGLGVRYCPRIRRESISLSLLSNLPSYVKWADVIHLSAVYSFPTLPTLALCKRWDKPVVWTPRGALQRWAKSRRRGMKALWDRACENLCPQRLVIHATSEVEAAACHRRLPQCRIVTIPNGVDVIEEREPLERKGVFRLLFMGRLDPIKGIENLLVACAHLRADLVGPWELVIAGDGEAAYRRTLEDHAQELGVKVRFVGWISGAEKEVLLAQADLLVAPSHQENFCMAIAEALAHGVPVLASHGTPWPRLESKGCGLWVPNDPESLTLAIERLRSMPLSVMGEKGRLWMKHEFAWAHVAKQMHTLYEGVLAS